jgi:predicted small secreted protein
MPDRPASRPSLLRTLGLLLAAALLLAACATNPGVRAGGSADGRATRGTVGIGWPL